MAKTNLNLRRFNATQNDTIPDARVYSVLTLSKKNIGKFEKAATCYET